MLGCPPDYFSKDGQAWGFPVMNPDRMYNEDGSLDEGGVLLKNLYKKMFRENPGGGNPGGGNPMESDLTVTRGGLSSSVSSL